MNIKKLSIFRLDDNITKIFLIWYLLIIIIFWLGFLYIPHGSMYHQNVFESLANWDGDHYLAAAKTGYVVKDRLAFFPLYPLLIKLLTYLTQNFLLSAVLINFVCCVMGVNIFYKLVLADFNKQIASRAFLMLLCFPTAFFLIPAYSEALFLLLTMLSFYFARKKRFLLAAVCSGLATATRAAGLAVAAGLLVELLKAKLGKKLPIYLIISISGFLFFMLYQYFLTGDFLFFIKAETNWQRYLTFPGSGFLESLINLITYGINPVNVSLLTEILFAIFGVGMVLRSFRFLPLSYSIYALVSVSLPLLTTTLLSIPRFLLPIFPIFILIGLIKKSSLIISIQFLSVMLLSLFAVLYINGYWVS